MFRKFILKTRKYNACDYLVVVLTTMLVIFGIVMVFSASYYSSLSSASGSPFSYLKKQLVFALVGFVLMYVMSYTDYHLMRRWSLWIILISYLLLVAVLTPLGTSVNGAQRWIILGPVSLMPGEIAKFGVICFVASYFASDIRRIKSFFRGVLPMVLLGGTIGVLIIRQPNLSTAITVVGIIFGMMFIAGLEKKWIAGAFALGVAGLIVVARSQTFWAKRIMSFTNPFRDPKGTGFQAVQSLLALGTGGFTGLGLGKSVQKNLYLPEPQNDFILAIIGEELGFLGIFILLIVFILLVYRGMQICMNAPDRFGMMMAGGITIMIGLQVVLNVAVVTSSMPVTGIALPFISYGGNSLWILMGSVGVLLNISRQSERPAPVITTRETRKVRLRRRKSA